MRNAIRHWLGLDASDARMEAMMATLDGLKTQVAANTSAEQSAIVLLNGLGARLAEIATDPAAVTAMAAELKMSADSLGAAVVANTPAAPNAQATPSPGVKGRRAA